MCDPYEFRIVKVERAKMRSWCAAVFVLSTGLSGLAQSGTIGISVLDSLEGAPIENVSLTWTERGAPMHGMTDDRGY